MMQATVEEFAAEQEQRLWMALAEGGSLSVAAATLDVPPEVLEAQIVQANLANAQRILRRSSAPYAKELGDLVATMVTQGGAQKTMAEALGVPPLTINRRLERYGLRRRAAALKLVAGGTPGSTEDAPLDAPEVEALIAQMEQALEAFGYNHRKARDAMGIAQRTWWRHIARFGIVSQEAPERKRARYLEALITAGSMNAAAKILGISHEGVRGVVREYRIAPEEWQGLHAKAVAAQLREAATAADAGEPATTRSDGQKSTLRTGTKRPAKPRTKPRKKST